MESVTQPKILLGFYFHDFIKRKFLRKDAVQIVKHEGIYIVETFYTYKKFLDYNEAMNYYNEIISTNEKYLEKNFNDKNNCYKIIENTA